MKQWGFTSIRKTWVVTIAYSFLSVILPQKSLAAEYTPNTLIVFEKLQEMTHRKERFVSNPWPVRQLERVDNYYVWQPETLSYVDQATGHEVWVLTHGPDIAEVFSKEHGTNAWSFDGSRIGFFSSQRPTQNESLGRYHYRWVVNTDGSGLRAVEGYGRYDYPFAGFGWAHTENSYYAFGSNTAEITGSAPCKLFINKLDINNRATGAMVLDTCNISVSKKEIVKDGVSSNDTRITFRDFEARIMNTPNPVKTTAIYFASLGESPEINKYWGIARGVGLTAYNTYLYAGELRWHDVWAPGPTGSWIVGQYSGSSLFVLLKEDGSASDGGPQWQDWNGVSFGLDEIKIISNGKGIPGNPYGNPYFGHPAFDRWGRYAVIGTYTDLPRPGTRIYDLKNNKMEPHYVMAYRKYDGQHHSWTGWTDYIIGVDPQTNVIYANEWHRDYQSAFPIVDTHYPRTSRNYLSYPRPSQSPDGTKVAFAATWLNNGENYPYIAWAVVYYPSPPKDIKAKIVHDKVRLSWVRPSYTKRGWPNEDVDPPPTAKEIKGYHVWVSKSDKLEWQEITSVALAAEYFDIDQPIGSTWYYAVTSEEYSRLESRHLSDIHKVSVDVDGRLTDELYASEGKQNFWKALPAAPAPCEMRVEAGSAYKLTWVEPSDPKVRYYNIYYSSSHLPPIEQHYRIASLPIGTTTFVDWLADKRKQGFYRITSVDRLGNEGGNCVLPSGLGGD